MSESARERIERILHEHGASAAPYGPHHDELRELIEEELTIWLEPEQQVGGLAEIIAWEIEAAFPVGPKRTREERLRTLQEWRDREGGGSI